MALNLVQHRGGPNVWDRGRTPRRVEQWIGAAASAALLIGGLRVRGWSGLTLVLAGGTLAWWTVGGPGEGTGVRASLRAVWPRRTDGEDSVTEASEESFPASDAPSWTPTTGHGQAH